MIIQILAEINLRRHFDIHKVDIPRVVFRNAEQAGMRIFIEFKPMRISRMQIIGKIGVRLSWNQCQSRAEIIAHDDIGRVA